MKTFKLEISQITIKGKYIKVHERYIQSNSTQEALHVKFQKEYKGFGVKLVPFENIEIVNTEIQNTEIQNSKEHKRVPFDKPLPKHYQNQDDIDEYNRLANDIRELRTKQNEIMYSIKEKVKKDPKYSVISNLELDIKKYSKGVISSINITGNINYVEYTKEEK